MFTELIAKWAMASMDHPAGLFGAGVFMALESMIAPVPSEVVMPPLGMLVHEGKFSWMGAIGATSVGSLMGSLVSYYMGLLGGKRLVMKIGRYLLINERHLDLTTAWFNKRGSLTVFLCRFIPVVRHFISIPAGIARMNVLKFCVYTLIGATIWNSFLLWLGYKLQKHWGLILRYRGPIDVAVIGMLGLCVVAWYWLHLRKPRTSPLAVAAAETEDPR